MLALRPKRVSVDRVSVSDGLTSHELPTFGNGCARLWVMIGLGNGPPSLKRFLDWVERINSGGITGTERSGPELDVVLVGGRRRRRRLLEREFSLREWESSKFLSRDGDDFSCA